jgi:hypothetical protein
MAVIPKLIRSNSTGKLVHNNYVGSIVHKSKYASTISWGYRVYKQLLNYFVAYTPDPATFPPSVWGTFVSAFWAQPWRTSSLNYAGSTHWQNAPGGIWVSGTVTIDVFAVPASAQGMILESVSMSFNFASTDGLGLAMSGISSAEDYSHLTSSLWGWVGAGDVIIPAPSITYTVVPNIMLGSFIYRTNYISGLTMPSLPRGNPDNLIQGASQISIVARLP